MNHSTVRSLVSFLIEHPELSTDSITMNSEGFVHATLNMTKDGTLDVQFRPSGNVLFIYAVHENGSKYLKILKTGEMSPNDMLKTVVPLVEHVT